MKNKRVTAAHSVEHKHQIAISSIVVAIVMMATITIISYIWGDSVLKVISMGYLPMSMSSAIAFLLGAIILMHRGRVAVQFDDAGHIIIPIVAYTLLLFMSMTFFQDLFRLQEMGVPTVLFGYDILSREATRGPSLMSIINFLLVATTNMAYSFELKYNRKVQMLIGNIIVITGVIALMGYVTNTAILYYDIDGLSKGMSLQGAILFILLGAGFALVGSRDNAL